MSLENRCQLLKLIGAILTLDFRDQTREVKIRSDELDAVEESLNMALQKLTCDEAKVKRVLDLDRRRIELESEKAAPETDREAAMDKQELLHAQISKCERKFAEAESLLRLICSLKTMLDRLKPLKETAEDKESDLTSAQKVTDVHSIMLRLSTAYAVGIAGSGALLVSAKMLFAFKP